MTNPFTRFRQWQKERYYNNILFVIEAQCRLIEAYRTIGLAIGEKPKFSIASLATPEERALRKTRAHFNDHTFQPRGKQ